MPLPFETLGHVPDLRDDRYVFLEPFRDQGTGEELWAAHAWIDQNGAGPIELTTSGPSPLLALRALANCLASAWREATDAIRHPQPRMYVSDDLPTIPNASELMGRTVPRDEDTDVTKPIELTSIEYAVLVAAARERWDPNPDIEAEQRLWGRPIRIVEWR